jgi:hypothetical protein
MTRVEMNVVSAMVQAQVEIFLHIKQRVATFHVATLCNSNTTDKFDNGYLKT